MLRILVILPFFAFVVQSTLGVFLHNCKMEEASVRQMVGKTHCCKKMPANTTKTKQCEKKKTGADKNNTCHVEYASTIAEQPVKKVDFLSPFILSSSTVYQNDNHQYWNYLKIYSFFYDTGPPDIQARFRYKFIQRFSI